MSFASGQVICPSNAATIIVPATNANANLSGSNLNRSVVINNPSAQGVYLGGSAVTTATGFLLASGATVTLALGPADVVYGRGASFSPVVYYIEGGVSV